MTIIRVVDVETCGLEPPAGIVEIGWCDIGHSPVMDWMVYEPPLAQLCHPGQSIPPETSAIHHLTDADVADALAWQDVWMFGAKPPVDGVRALAGHRTKFDRQWLTDERTGGLPWIDTYKCAARIWPDAPGHGNQLLRYWLKPAGLERDLATPAHRAGPDAYVTAHLLRDMLNEHATVEQLIEWSSQPVLQQRCMIGKWRGRPWSEVDDGMLNWILTKDFDEDVQFTVRHEIERRKGART